MTHEEQRVWLIRELFAEDPYYQNYRIPEGEQEQKDLLRSLMNVREPKPIGLEFQNIQDAYLKTENEAAGITDVEDLTPVKADERLFLWQGDITTLKIGAIINPANSALLGCFRPMHNCADNIIHSKAGIELRLCCNRIMKLQGHEEETGKAKITPAYNLPCDYVIHTVGPIVEHRLTKKHEELLASCYNSCLAAAEENGVESIAFCCISTGVFRFPNDRAAKIAVRTVREYLKNSGAIRKVVFNVYKDLDRELYDRLLNGK